MRRLAIVGGGSWGTALALALSPRFEQVRLWMHDAELARCTQASRENATYLPGVLLPLHVDVRDDIAAVVQNCDVLLGVMPSRHARDVYGMVRTALQGHRPVLVSATKGLEAGTLLRMSQVAEQVLGESFQNHLAALSGPTFAQEVAHGEPAALVVASSSAEVAAQVQAAFSTPTFRVYTNADIAGVETGAALKNVIAIGAGICQGLGLGNNTMAALVTRGLAEMSRLAEKLGGKRETLAGLAGLGDLVLTCTGDLSRNRQVGIALGKGAQLEEVLGSMRMVAEGVHTVHAAVELAARHQVELPITQQMHAILTAGRSPREALRELMERAPKRE